MDQVKDLTGRRFRKLLVLRREMNGSHRHARWQCRCDCGKLTICLSSNLLRGISKSCGCLRKDGSWHQLRPFEWLYTRITKTKHECILTYKQFLEFTKTNRCHYCFAEIVWTKHKRRGESGRYNLDRKDNAKGYSKKNCVVCCTRCNYGKNRHFTYEEWWTITACFRKGKR